MEVKSTRVVRVRPKPTGPSSLKLTIGLLGYSIAKQAFQKVDNRDHGFFAFEIRSFVCRLSYHNRGCVHGERERHNLLDISIGQ